MTGKKVLFSVFLLAFISSCLIFVFFGYNAIWTFWNVPTMSPHFADTRAITSGAEAHALGYDPLYNNVRDPWQRPMNLTHLWQILFYFGLNQSHTTLIGSIFIILFFLSPFIFIKTLPTSTACVLSFAFISPAVMLGVERATPDLFLFFLLALGLRIGYTSTIAETFFVLFASFLKLFPIFGIFFLLKESKFRFWGLFTLACTVFLIYIIFTFNDVKQMVHVTPRGTEYSYGVNVFWMRLEELTQSPHLKNISVIIQSLGKKLSYLTLITIFIVSGLSVFRKRDINLLENEQHIDAFRLGAGVYIGTFMFGNNWDYRLIFLIFTIPQIVSWIKKKINPYSLICCFILPAIILSFWYLIVKQILGSNLAFLIDQFSKWVVFSGLVYLLLASLPSWLSSYFYRLIDINRSKVST
ncbi:hypothetical protein [Aetokthonos hydrillicola]|uniref:hypothetical protein n=1 Tax=Aetokthonos hydrillicola TaxID=1550245 RepID=UPI001ABB3B45